MGKLLNYNGSDKVKKRIADVLNVTDVRKDGDSMVDNDGIVDLSVITQIQVELETLIRMLGLTYANEDDYIYTNENGDNYTAY